MHTLLMLIARDIHTLEDDPATLIPLPFLGDLVLAREGAAPKFAAIRRSAES